MLRAQVKPASSIAPYLRLGGWFRRALLVRSARRSTQRTPISPGASVGHFRYSAQFRICYAFPIDR